MCVASTGRIIGLITEAAGVIKCKQPFVKKPLYLPNIYLYNMNVSYLHMLLMMTIIKI
jgi:hypothetical protein